MDGYGVPSYLRHTGSTAPDMDIRWPPAEGPEGVPGRDGSHGLEPKSAGKKKTYKTYNMAF